MIKNRKISSLRTGLVTGKILQDVIELGLNFSLPFIVVRGTRYSETKDDFSLNFESFWWQFRREPTDGHSLAESEIK